MKLIGNGITSVRAYILPAGVYADGQFAASPRWAVVHWRSAFENMYYQVYVAGKFAGVTTSTTQRRLLVPVPDCHIYPVTIEVFAVRPEDADLDLSDELAWSYSGASHVRLKILRSQQFDTGGTLNIYSALVGSFFNYEQPLNDLPIPLWPCWQGKTGFGLCRFGRSDFGWDSSAAVGLGCGCFGMGEFGLDADAIVWESEPLPDGWYRLALVFTDQHGNMSTPLLTEPIPVTSDAMPPVCLEVDSYNSLNNQLILKII
jgi:hypothetical protein